jgi:hypothetical protein
MALLENLATYLTAQGYVGGATGWSYSIGRVLAEPDQLVTLSRFAGRFPDPGTGLERPGVQIRVRAADYATAEAKALALLRGLQLRPPGTITGVRYMHAEAGPIPLGEDENGRPEFSVNFEAGEAA